jgi:HD-like signal output (HDOD) protein
LPEAVIRIRNALSKPDFTVEELARIITTEPTLVGSILTMANSVTFRRAGNETSDLKVAISRIGVGMVQTAATTFALRKLRESDDFKDVEHLLAPEWARSARTAATTYLVAQKTRALRADEGLVVGLLHNIGRIYLFSRAPDYPDLFQTPEDGEEILSSWHANVAKAIVESWAIPGTTVEAIARQDEIDEDEESPKIYSVLTVGIALAAVGDDPAPEEKAALLERHDFRRLGIIVETIDEILEERDSCAAELGLGMKS